MGGETITQHRLYEVLLTAGEHQNSRKGHEEAFKMPGPGAPSASSHGQTGKPLAPLPVQARPGGLKRAVSSCPERNGCSPLALVARTRPPVLVTVTRETGSWQPPALSWGRPPRGLCSLTPAVVSQRPAQGRGRSLSSPATSTCGHQQHPGQRLLPALGRAHAATAVRV